MNIFDYVQCTSVELR